MSLSRSNDVSARYCHILGIAYQVLGDAALAARAVNTVYVRFGRTGGDTVAWWGALVEVLHQYMARGFVVRPLAPEGQNAALLHALQQLEPSARMVVLLRYHEALTITDIATVMATDPATIRRILAESRSYLLHGIGARDAV